MNDPEDVSGVETSRTWRHVGPIIPASAIWTRYVTAFFLVLVVSAARLALTPFLGTQSPLLPLVLAVLMAAYLAGRGPAVFASLLAPLCATFWFATWPNGTAAWQWSAHVAFFLLLSLAITFLIDALQRTDVARVAALESARKEVNFRQRAEDALRDSHRSKDEFLAMLAHELRNPLAPIRNIAHILARGSAEVDNVRRASEVLGRQATHLARLVDDLLDVSRITRGTIELKPEIVDLQSVVDAALEAMEPHLSAKGQKIFATHDVAAVAVNADPIRLTQVFVNLLSNASKYSPSGARIDIIVSGNNNDAAVLVKDEGHGIDPQLMPHIFDLFRQGDRSLDRTEGGLGIGLTIVKRLVEMHGGRIEAESAGQGHGTAFRVHLPRMDRASPAAHDESPGASSPRPSLRILIAEDNTDAANTLATLLGSANHAVKVVHTGPAALEAVETFAPHVALLDIGLPRMDGYLVANEIRTRLGDHAPRLIAITGYATESDRELALRAGFDVHLAKPIDPAHLLDLLAHPVEDIATRTNYSAGA
jgi:two-component system CheB/CheR fusion protein